MERRKDLVEVVEGGREKGARAVEVLRVDREVYEQRGSRQRMTGGMSTTWTVRVWRDAGESGIGVGSTRDAALSEALRLAASAPPDPLAGPADRMSISSASIGIHDRRHKDLTDEDRAEVLMHAERALHQGGIQLQSFLYQQVKETRTWTSSRGVEAHEIGTTYALSADAALHGEVVHHRMASRHFSDVASLPFGQEVRKRLESLVRRATRPDGPRKLVLEPRVSAELVRGLAPLFDARAVSQGSPLSGWVGKRLSEVLHVTDDGGLPSGLHSHLFDDRGVPPIPVPILREGHVASLYHDVEGARAQGMRPTGHVRDGGIRPSNLVVRPGARTRNVILTELQSWLQPDRLPPFDLTTGRFTGEVPMIRVDGGERVGSFVARMDVDFVTVLRAVLEAAADQERTCEVDAPTLVLAPLL